MAEAQSFHIQFEVKLVPAEDTTTDVSGYMGGGQVIISGQAFNVFFGGFVPVSRPGAVQGIAAQGIAAQGIAAQGIAAQGIAAQGIAAQGIAAQGIAGRR